MGGNTNTSTILEALLLAFAVSKGELTEDQAADQLAAKIEADKSRASFNRYYYMPTRNTYLYNLAADDWDD